MSTSTPIAEIPTVYTITRDVIVGGYNVLADGFMLKDDTGRVHNFTSRNSARKRIARERSGNFHR